MAAEYEDASGVPTPSAATSRRTVLKATGAGLAMVVGGSVAGGNTGAGIAHAETRDDAARHGSHPDVGGLLMRTIPRTGEKVPAVGLGTFMTFDKLPHADRSSIGEVMRTFVEGGGRVVDTSVLYGMSEANVGEFAARLRLTDRLFFADKTWATGEYLGERSHVERQFAQTRERLRRDVIDVLQVHSLTNAEMNVPILREWKAEGRIRYVGVTHHIPAYFPAVENWIRTGEVDFVQVHYSIAERTVEERLLPAAADHGTAVLVNMPLEKARLPAIVEGRRLPGIARELGCRSWAQFFLKYVLSHPAVTCVLPATTNPDHAAENVEAMRGPLPDRRMRKLMVRCMERIPGFADIPDMPWYPGKTFEDGLVKL